MLLNIRKKKLEKTQRIIHFQEHIIPLLHSKTNGYRKGRPALSTNNLMTIIHFTFFLFIVLFAIKLSD